MHNEVYKALQVQMLKDCSEPSERWGRRPGQYVLTLGKPPALTELSESRPSEWGLEGDTKPWSFGTSEKEFEQRIGVVEAFVGLHTWIA